MTKDFSKSLLVFVLQKYRVFLTQQELYLNQQENSSKSTDKCTYQTLSSFFLPKFVPIKMI